MKILIKNGRVVDPANNLDEVLDILVENSKISKVAKNIKNGADAIIDAADKIVMPGIIDMHVHLREPGREDKETIASGTRAAAKGGVTSILAMPNNPIAVDSIEQVRRAKEIIKKDACVNVYICAAITKGRQGKELTPIKQLKEEGIIAISDDGSSVDIPEIMLAALEEAKRENLLLLAHCEDKSISAHGVVNLGLTSTCMGLRGSAKEAEYKRIERDIELAKKAGAAIHITHISCQESAEIIALAKKKGVRVTCDVTPHHFSFSEEAVLGYDTNFKMNPPLRSKTDTAALRQGLKDGTIDAIASDHAPHTENEKEIEFERAEFGVIGLETELSAAITGLIQNKILDWPGLVIKMSLNPAQALGLNKGRLGAGSDADIIIVDPKREWTVKKEGLFSKSGNCAFLGKKLNGVVEYTICNGRVIYKLEEGRCSS